MMDRRAFKRFLWLHAGALAALALFPLYRWGTGLLSKYVPGCALHDFLHLYCPMCGGTRALASLLRLDLLAALKQNAFAVLLFGTVLVFYVIAWIRLLRGEVRLWRVPDWFWIVGVAVMVLFGVLRNLMMIAWGMDPLGDLLPFWNGIKAVGAY